MKAKINTFSLFSDADVDYSCYFSLELKFVFQPNPFNFPQLNQRHNTLLIFLAPNITFLLFLLQPLQGICFSRPSALSPQCWPSPPAVSFLPQKFSYPYFQFFCLWWIPFSIKQRCCGAASECELLANWKIISSSTSQQNKLHDVHVNIF